MILCMSLVSADVVHWKNRLTKMLDHKPYFFLAYLIFITWLTFTHGKVWVIREFVEIHLNSVSKNTSETDILPLGTKSFLSSVISTSGMVNNSCNLISHYMRFDFFEDLLALMLPGKRLCAGETFARQTIFVILSALIQNFNIKGAPGKPLPSEEPDIPGIILTKKDMWLQFEPRAWHSLNPHYRLLF